MIKSALSLSSAAVLVAASPVFADWSKVSDKAEFMQLVSGKSLVRPFVDLKVSADGSIAGKGAAWAVTGNWTWKQGFFCRSLFWGGDDLGYNCQEVTLENGRLRFTSDRGAGKSADFRLK